MNRAKSKRVRMALHRHGITTAERSGRHAVIVTGNIVKLGLAADPAHVEAITAADRRRTSDVKLTGVSRRRQPTR